MGNYDLVISKPFTNYKVHEFVVCGVREWSLTVCISKLTTVNFHVSLADSSILYF